MVRLLAAATVLVTCLAAMAAGSARATRTDQSENPYIIVLGVAQDAGYPQAACRRDCCVAAREDPTRRRMVVCLGIVDPQSDQRWIIECTPDFREQLAMLDEAAPPDPKNVSQCGLDGIFITHAHIGHYTGLMQLGREVMGADHVPVHVMPRLKQFLECNGPWDQLVSLGNIEPHAMTPDEPVRLSERISVTPLLVPHRDEYSETVGFRIEGPTRSVLFIPDIDKWNVWERSIEDEVARVDIAYLDGTFFRNGEVFGRNMSLIPHPFIEESMQRFAPLPASERAKVRFIHFNHTNPAMREGSEAAQQVGNAGMSIAIQGEREQL